MAPSLSLDGSVSLAQWLRLSRSSVASPAPRLQGSLADEPPADSAAGQPPPPPPASPARSGAAASQRLVLLRAKPQRLLRHLVCCTFAAAPPVPARLIDILDVLLESEWQQGDGAEGEPRADAAGISCSSTRVLYGVRSSVQAMARVRGPSCK